MPSHIAVGFDFDHTLGIDNKLERRTALELLATLAAAGGHNYEVSAAEAAIDQVLAAYRNGEQSVEAAIAGFFERFAPSGRATLDYAQDFRDKVVERAGDFVEALPGAQAMLAELDALDVTYALLTNGWSPFQEEKARLIAFRGSVFVSERIGVRKPAREAFEVLAKHFELPLERIWYVGDDPEVDCAGARAQGITTVWFDWEGREYPPQIAQPDHVIHSLDELSRLIQGHVSETAKTVG